MAREVTVGASAKQFTRQGQPGGASARDQDIDERILHGALPFSSQAHPLIACVFIPGDAYELCSLIFFSLSESE
jgi:hypothetical protein